MKFDKLTQQEKQKLLELMARLGQQTSRRQSLQTQLRTAQAKISELSSLNQTLKSQLLSQRTRRQQLQRKNENIFKQIQGLRAKSRQFQQTRQRLSQQKSNSKSSKRIQIDQLKLDLQKCINRKKNQSHINIQESSIQDQPHSFFTHFDTVRKPQPVIRSEKSSNITRMQKQWQDEVAKISSLKEKLQKRGSSRKKKYLFHQQQNSSQQNSDLNLSSIREQRQASLQRTKLNLQGQKKTSKLPSQVGSKLLQLIQDFQ